MPPPPRGFQGAPRMLANPRPRPGRALLAVLRCEAGLGDKHYVRAPLGDRVQVPTQGRDIGLRNTHWPRVGLYVPATQQQEGGETQQRWGGGCGAPVAPAGGGGGAVPTPSIHLAANGQRVQGVGPEGQQGMLAG